ncbi:methyltransferase [Brachybacterium sp. DNPG3]
MDTQQEIVLEVLEGCADSAAQEASPLGPVRIVGPTELTLRCDDLDAVRSLRCVVAAYAAITVPARRPRELLETSVTRRIAAVLEAVRRQRPRQRFHGLRLAAAGSSTPEMRRIAEELAQLAGLEVDETDGDQLVRVRRADSPEPAWQVLVRTTPRPLATRAWRTVNYPGAVNGTIAASALQILGVGPEDALLDMTCGSGTFLIEQLHRSAPRRAVGVDLDPAAIDAARAHQRAARQKGRIDWIVGDVREVELEGGFTRILTNPPWGTLHGDHETNQSLLVDLLDRAGRLAAPGARLGILTHEIRRMHAALDEIAGPWHPVLEHRFFQKGHHPRLFVLERR